MIVKPKGLRVALTTRSLTRGGAQIQLVKLATALRLKGALPEVIVFYEGGVLESTLLASGVPVHCLGKRRRWDVAGVTAQYLALVRRQRFDVIYSFLPMANLLSLAVSRVARVPVVWGLRGAAQDVGQHGYASRLLYRLQSMLRRAPDRIISNSYAAISELGERADGHFRVVTNGIDTKVFHPDASARESVRKEFGCDESVKLVGCIARFDSVKDHPTFLRAAALIAGRRSDVRFVAVGSGPECYRAHLQLLARESGLESRLVWAGERSDVARVMCALDVYISASRAEGSSNSLAEAMACGIAPAVTDAGDSARIVDVHGSIVPPRDPEALAQAVLAWLDQDTDQARIARRAWIAETLGVERMVEETLLILSSVARRKPNG